MCIVVKWRSWRGGAQRCEWTQLSKWENGLQKPANVADLGKKNFEITMACAGCAGTRQLETGGFVKHQSNAMHMQHLRGAFDDEQFLQ